MNEPTAKPRHKVMVATDLGEWGDAAVREADRWARAWNADLLVVHCVPIHASLSPLLPQLSSDQQAELETIERRAANALTDRVVALTDRTPDEFSRIIESGTPHVEIVRAAEEHHADLLVVGARGSSGLLRSLVGHSAEKVARFAHCPVLVVRPSPASGEILVATDMSKGATIAIQVASELARSRSGKLTALHVVDTAMPFPLDVGIGMASLITPEIAVATTSPMTRELLFQRAREDLKAHLASLSVTAEAAVADGSVVDAMATKAKALPAELVVVGTIGRTGLARVTLGNTAEGAIRDLPCSVLVVRTAERSP